MNFDEFFKRLRIKDSGETKKGLGSGTMWLVLAMLLFFIDYMGGPRYSGFEWVWGSGNIANVIINIVTTSVFITIVFVYFITKIAKKGGFANKDDIFFIIFALILSFFILNSAWVRDLRALLHFVIILLFGLVFIGNEENWGYAYLFTSILLLIDFFGYPLLKHIYVLQYIPFLTFIIIIYVYMETQDEMAILAFIILIVIMFILMWNDPALKQYKGGFVFLAESKDGVTLTELWEKIGTGWQGYWENTQKSFQTQMEYATGGYYKGQVEEKTEVPLGVFIEKLMVSSEKYFPNEPILIWADLRARTLKEPIGITMKCRVGEDDTLMPPGEVKPDYFENSPLNFNITTLEQESIQCKFPSLPSGTHNVKLSAEFNFETMAYLKTYFMDIERMRALRRDEIDPLGQYGITDKNPVAVFTNGPVKIGIGTNNQLPIGLGKDYIQNPRLGITIENQWNGRIKNITKLIVFIPKSMELERTSEGICNGWFEEMNNLDELDEVLQDEDYRSYKMTETLRKKINEKPIYTFISRRCIININKNNVQNVLGTTPVAVHYYRAYVKYIYDVEQSISVKVIRLPSKSTSAAQTSSGDQNMPTGLSIMMDNNGDGIPDTETDDIDVILRLSGSGDGCRYSNDGGNWSTWSSVVILQEWRLSPGPGTKTVYYQCKIHDDSDNVILSDTVSTDIELKTVI